MACEGEGIFMTTLNKVNTYAVSPDIKTLNFTMGDIAMMHFEKNKTVLLWQTVTVFNI